MLQISAETNSRPYKGKRLIAFPSTYVVLDIETTGCSPDCDNIIEVGAIRYKNGAETDRFISLVQPPAYGDGTFVNEYITKLTGITNEMLSKVPKTKEVIEKLANFLGDDIIVGYNTNFDILFLYDNFIRYLGKPLSNDFIDAMRFARKLYPNIQHHKLIDMVEMFNIDREKAHRALPDVEATHKCFIILIEEAMHKFGSEEQFAKAFSDSVRAKDIQCNSSEINSENPIFAQYCVFTGRLERFVRRDAMQLVANLGGFTEDNVTKKTNFLILGNNDYCNSIEDGKTSKQKKAEKLKLAGQDIEIIPEKVFYDMINDFC